MKKYFSHVVPYIILLLLASTVSATTTTSKEGGFKVTYPESINVFEPVKLHIEVTDKELIDNVDYIFGQFSVPLSEGDGFEHQSDLTADGPRHYLYNGEKSFDIVISLLANSALDLNNKELNNGKENDLETLREIAFHSDKDGVLDRIRIPIYANKYNFDVKNIPEGFVQQKKDLNTLIAMYSKSGDEMTNHLTISMISYNYNFHDEQKLLSKNEIMTEVPVPDGWTKETFTINEDPAYLTTSCNINGWEKEDRYNGECLFSGEIFTKIGRLIFNMRRKDNGFKPKATIEIEVETWKAQAKEAIQNIIMDGGKVAEVKQDEETSIYGYLTDIDGDPLPYMLIILNVDGKVFATNYTDLNGNYKIDTSDLNFKKDEEKPGIIYFYLDYFKDETNYYKLYVYNERNQEYSPAFLFEEITLKQDENLELNPKLDGTPNDPKLGSNLANYGRMRDYGVIYYHMHEAVEFATEKLFQKVNHALPVEVYIGNLESSTLYNPGQSIIEIAKSDESYFNKDNPRNREYHEFAHHLMFSTYGSWTGDSTMKGVINHAGFINPTSADSFDEGFAEYNALATAKFLGYKDADIYGGFGSMEDNFKPWDSKGRLEEFAIASLLWDMIDSKNEPGDSLTMSIEDVWRVIGVKQADMYGYYKAFIKRFPDKKDAFDDLFILHGFFANTKEGNKKKDPFEPSLSTESKTTFIDLSCNKTPCIIKYENNMTIGQATNYDRPTRSQAVRIDGSYIKVDLNGPRFFKITVDYEDQTRETYSYIVEMRNGLLYVQPRPDDVKATFTIEPDTRDFTYNQAYSITNSELIEKIYSDEDMEYFAEPDFGIEKLNTKLDPVYSEDGFEPKFTNDLGRLDEIKPKITKGDTDIVNSNSSSSFSFGKILLLLLIVAFIYAYIKYPTVKKQVNSIIKETVSLCRQFTSRFKKK